MQKIDFDKKVLIDLYINQKMPAYKIGSKFGVSEKCIRRNLIKHNIPLRNILNGTALQIKNYRVKDNRGYILIRKPEHPNALSNGYIREHRYIMEKIIGRYLLPTEVVDHINGVKDDNRPENLRLLRSQSDHVRLEFKRGVYKNTHKNQARNKMGQFI